MPAAVLLIGLLGFLPVLSSIRATSAKTLALVRIGAPVAAPKAGPIQSHRPKPSWSIADSARADRAFLVECGDRTPELPDMDPAPLLAGAIRSR